MLLGTFQRYFVLCSLRSDSQVLVLLVPPKSTNLSDLFVTAWSAYFTAFLQLHTSSSSKIT
jgi:hypothetical protein